MFIRLLKPAIKIKDIEKDLNICIIDIKLEKILRGNLFSQSKKFEDFIYKLKIFSFLTNTKLNHLNLLNKDHSLFFSNFIFFTVNNGFTNKDRFKKDIISTTTSVIEHFNKISNEPINLDTLPNLTIHNINQERVKLLNGWSYEHPTLKSKIRLNLYSYSVLWGVEESNKIENIINSVQQYRVEVFVFNEFFKYLVNNKMSIFNAMSIDVLQDFMKKHFKNIIDNKKCLNTAKREWNIFIKSLKGYFGLDKDLKLKLTRKHKDPNEMNLKLVDGKIVKDKLITHIPLEITDDKALYLIKDKINQDISIVRNWAVFNLKEFDNLRDLNKVPTRKELYSIFILLTMENPAITESFLCTLTSQNSYIQTDNNHYLIGKKPRRGNELAEQKIQLSSISVNIIKKYLEWTNNIPKTNDSFFIYKGREGLRYMRELKSKSLYNQGVKESLKYYLIKMGLTNEHVENIVKNSYFSKIRATMAIKVYFETENTTKMSQALGHHTYDARLLSHYLPQSILDFYQQRWIKIFQKGLICEALKNSDLLLKASNFKSIEDLDLFLRNHMLKNLPDNLNDLFCDNDTNQNKNNNDSIFISINRENLAALFSLQNAVNESDKKTLISEKAFFWHNFCEHLEKEILNNREYKEFKKILYEAKEKSNFIKFNEVIYE